MTRYLVRDLKRPREGFGIHEGSPVIPVSMSMGVIILADGHLWETVTKCRLWG